MVRKVPCVFIDYSNKEQVKWWNKIGGRLVKARLYDTIVETATDKPVGIIVVITGIFAKYVINKMNSFHKETTEMVLQ